MKFSLLLAIIIFCFIPMVFSQDSITASEAAYNKTIDTRAAKIVANLGISDEKKAVTVKDIIAGQYKNLGAIYDERDRKIAMAKKNEKNSKEAIAAEVATIHAGVTPQLGKLHTQYLKALAAELSPEQVDKVKDGMTYNVLHVTYNGYNQMVQTLTAPQQKQIMEWLVEARELAMDAESSDKKHATFGKYKGRINNYLSAQGYDLKKEGEAWEVRIKEAAAKKQSSN